MSKLCLVDSDALIGALHDNDLLHKRCLKILDYVNQNDISLTVVYPLVLEAATTLSRRLNHPELAGKLLRDFSSIENSDIDLEVGEIVADLYQPKTSKKNTPFDHYVLALAKKNNIKHIFSFNDFYKKNGLTLLEDLL
jgi:predicted nucleic acid-binding protein